MHLVDMSIYWFWFLEAAFIKYLFTYDFCVNTEMGKGTRFRIPWTTLNLNLNFIIAICKFGRPQFDSYQAHNISILFSSPFRFKARILWVQSPTSSLFFLLIYHLTLSPIQEVMGSIPTHHIYFFSPLFFCPNSLIFQEVVGSNPHSLTLF